MSDLTDRLETEARRQYLGSPGCYHAILTEAAAEIRRLVLLAGQQDIDRCDEVLRLRAELAEARELARRLGMVGAVQAGLIARAGAPPLSAPEAAVCGWRPEWVDTIGVIEDEVE